MPARELIRIKPTALLVAAAMLLSACGPGTSGDPTLTVASVSGPSDIQNGRAPETVPPTPTATQLATAAPLSEKSPAGLDWIAKDLQSPDIRLRLRALEAWAQQAPPGSVAPFILALNDPDEQVRARAQALIEQDWVRQRATPDGR